MARPLLNYLEADLDAYVTPTRYRSMPTGLDLSGQTDAELQAILYAASLAVNAACHAPEGYSFTGGSITGEEHQWRVGNAYKQPSGRIWVFNRPLKSVSLLKVNVTRTQYVDFSDTQVFVQTDLGYVEPVAAPNTTALFTSVPPWLLSSPVAYVDYEYGFDFVASNETLTTISGGVLQANHQFWFTDEDVELKKDGTVVDPDDYEIDYDEGTITPDSPASAVWKASYHYHLPPGIAAATALIGTDLLGQSAIAAAGLLGLSGIKVEEVELRQSSKVNFAVQPISAAARIYLGPYAAMFTSMR